MIQQQVKKFNFQVWKKRKKNLIFGCMFVSFEKVMLPSPPLLPIDVKGNSFLLIIRCSISRTSTNHCQRFECQTRVVDEQKNNSKQHERGYGNPNQ